MDLFFEKAKAFATEAAKRSQELAKEAAKVSQEIALQTAKRSKEIAVGATKKADEWKALAGEITPSIAAVASRGTASVAAPSEDELERYGITAELREFVNGLTIKTFEDFPLEYSNLPDGSVDAADTPFANIRQDLTEWQERHAVLVLKSVPKISHFRYVLCPRHMKESRFWKIYFTLVKSHVAPYEEQASQPMLAAKSLQDVISVPIANEQLTNMSSLSTPVHDTPEATKKAVTSGTDDQDLDAYLMGALGSSDEEGPDDDGFDADFDQLVNSTGLDSDAEEETDHLKKPGVSLHRKAVATSDGSSDGELVEIPSDLDIQMNPSEAGESRF